MTKGENIRCSSDALSRIYEENRPALMRYLFSYTRDTMDAEDMLHDLFLKLLSIDIINPSSVRNLLFTMARRLIIDDALHKAFVRRSVEGYSRCHSEGDEGSGERAVEEKDLVFLVNRKLSSMPERRARIYLMSRHYGMGAGEIAARLGLSRRTVESHIYTGSVEMKAYLKKII